MLQAWSPRRLGPSDRRRDSAFSNARQTGGVVQGSDRGCSRAPCFFGWPFRSGAEFDQQADDRALVFGEANEQQRDRPANIRLAMIEGVEQDSRCDAPEGWGRWPRIYATGQ